MRLKLARFRSIFQVVDTRRLFKDMFEAGLAEVREFVGFYKL